LTVEKRYIPMVRLIKAANGTNNGIK
jgi:hypothetical protein